MSRKLLTIMGLLALLGVLFFGLTSCQEGGERIAPTINRTGEDVLVRVYFYNNTREVTNMYRQLHSIPRETPVADTLGFAMWPEWRDAQGNPADLPNEQGYECEIHSIRPRLVNDKATTTLGHEMLHCLWGSYHRDHRGR